MLEDEIIEDVLPDTDFVDASILEKRKSLHVLFI